MNLFAQGEWWRETSIYQIYPRSFYDSDSDGIGDIAGIIAKLDDLKELGVETLWISPFFEGPQKDFGYDISNYQNIAQEFGDMQKVEQLISEIHSKGMKVLFDMVMNHTSDQHPWFLNSENNPEGEKADWYLWKDGAKPGKTPNNWKSVIGKKGWQYSEKRKQWYFTSFLPFQPDLNYRNPEVKEAMLNQMRFWLDKGIDGFRLDIFNVLFKDDQWRDNPKGKLLPTENGGAGQIREYTSNLPENFEFAKEVRNVMKEYGEDKFLLGEVMGEHHQIKRYLGENHDGLNATFLFDTLHFKFNANFFREKLKLYEEEYPAPYLPVFTFSNHDQMRSLSRLKGNITKSKILAMIQVLARGIPVIYQGEEIGMENIKVKYKDAQDPIAQFYKFVPKFLIKILGITVNRDEVRSPYQWNSQNQAGFCPNDCAPWLPVHQNYQQRNLEIQKNRENSLYQIYRQLLHLRKKHSAFKSGTMKILEPEKGEKNLLVFEREEEESLFRVILNFSRKKIKLKGRLNTGENIFSLKGERDEEIESLSGVIRKIEK